MNEGQMEDNGIDNIDTINENNNNVNNDINNDIIFEIMKPDDIMENTMIHGIIIHHFCVIIKFIIGK